MKTTGINQTLWVAICALILASCEKQETTVPVRKDIEEAVFTSGHLTQEDEYTVSAKADGIILSLSVREGDLVSENDVIALIESDVQQNQYQDALAVYEDAVRNASPDSPQLQSLKAQMVQAEKQLNFDRESFFDYKTLFETHSVSRLDFERAELQYRTSEAHLQALQENYREMEEALTLNKQRSLAQVNTQKALLDDHTLVTGASGTLVTVYKKQGELVRRGEAVARIGSGEFIMKLYIAEEDISRVNVGQSVAVSLNTYPDRVFEAVISKIYPGFDESEQSYVAEATFLEYPEKMFTGTQLQANIETSSRQDVLVIPTEYVQPGNYVQLDSGEERRIVTGVQNKTWTEVISGIDESHVITKSRS